MTSPVCSHNEWDPLEEVIVGDGFPESMPLLDFSFQHFFHDNIFGEPIYSEDCHKFINKRHVAEHNEDIEKFAELLASHNITVKRPKIPKKFINTKTLAWNSSNYPALNVRDLTMIVGDEIIEVSSSSRWRYFENDYLKHIFLDYFKRGARWTQSPKPIVTDNSFDMKYVYKTPGAKEHFDKFRNRHKHHYFSISFHSSIKISSGTRFGSILAHRSDSKNYEARFLFCFSFILGGSGGLWRHLALCFRQR